ncbi:MAG: CCA tRNA nucleotidyltransferase [Lachnospira sp.]|nr:CCA tRNA nucleotidyltransferase [Lachnospira sp.]
MFEGKVILPEAVQAIINTIEQNGFEAYAVGGCVRDSILGREPDDWDITTSAIPTKVKTFFKRTIDTGIKHGTVTVMMNKTGYEVTTYRIDGEYKDGRHPESVEFSVKLEDDLMRRDFTINAMAYNDSVGLVDAFDGIQDLERKVIRCVGDARERFTEDALRMMRAVRFSAQLGFSIDSATWEAIIELAPNITKVSMERVQVELMKTLLSDNPDYVRMYKETGLFKEILPSVHDVLSGKYSNRVLTMLKCAPKTQVLRLAALLTPLTPEEARDTLKSLKLDNYTVDTVSELIRNSKTVIEENEPAVREALHKYGKEMVELMMEYEQMVIATSEEIMGVPMTSRRKHLTVIKYMHSDIISRGDCISIKDLDINGNDLMEYGLSGKQIGKTLEELLYIVMENPRLNDKATLIAMIEHLGEIKRTD